MRRNSIAFRASAFVGSFATVPIRTDFRARYLNCHTSIFEDVEEVGEFDAETTRCEGFKRTFPGSLGGPQAMGH
jgi:hypothetical protein